LFASWFNFYSMLLLDTDRCRARIPLLLEMESSSASPAAKLIADRVQSPLNILSCAFTDDGVELLGYFSMAVVTAEFMRKVVLGKSRESDAESWEGVGTPVLFIRDLVISDCSAAPKLFRQALQDLQKLCLSNDIYIPRAFTIAHHWGVRKILLRYQFQEIGRTPEGNSILCVERDSSPIFKSCATK